MRPISARTLNHIQTVIELFGGPKTAAVILEESELTLKKLMRGDIKKMAAYTLEKWEQRQFKSQKEVMVFVSERIVELEDNSDLHDYFEARCEEKIKELEDRFDKALHSPIIGIYKRTIETEFLHKQDLIDELLMVLNKEATDTTQLLECWKQFASTYSHFRPPTIKHDDHYWGTVKLMDSISNTLTACFGGAFHQQFSSFGNNIIDRVRIKEMMENPHDLENFYWKELINDIVVIQHAIICQIGHDAMQQLYLCNKMSDRHFDFDAFAKAYLKHSFYHCVVEDWQSQCTIRPFVLSINGEDYRWQCENSLKMLMRKHLKNK